MKEYIGDSVYVSESSYAPGAIVLTTENGLPDDPSNEIYLEEWVFRALTVYVNRMKEQEDRAFLAQESCDECC